jgi:hypothetical protein
VAYAKNHPQNYQPLAESEHMPESWGFAKPLVEEYVSVRRAAERKTTISRPHK